MSNEDKGFIRRATIGQGFIDIDGARIDGYVMPKEPITPEWDDSLNAWVLPLRIICDEITFISPPHA